jgi:hypothetical protein
MSDKQDDTANVRRVESGVFKGYWVARIASRDIGSGLCKYHKDAQADADRWNRGDRTHL